MSIEKKFDAWISKNFKGLSIATLIQFLKTEDTVNMWAYQAQNLVHISLYKYFIGDRTDAICKDFEGVKWLVNTCDWL